jgi:hypothetical protein
MLLSSPSQNVPGLNQHALSDKHNRYDLDHIPMEDGMLPSDSRLRRQNVVGSQDSRYIARKPGGSNSSSGKSKILCVATSKREILVIMSLIQMPEQRGKNCNMTNTRVMNKGEIPTRRGEPFSVAHCFENTNIIIVAFHDHRNLFAHDPIREDDV